MDTNKDKKSILKNTPSKGKKKKKTQFDEMNVMATYHPAGKDYGHMKIDEPKTPFNPENEKSRPVDPKTLAEKLIKGGKPKILEDKPEKGEEDEDETPEAKAKREEFLRKRKQHYDEFKTAQKMKKLAQEEDPGSSKQTTEKDAKNVTVTSKKT